MILIKPSYKILRFPETPLEDLEEVARTCYKSEDKIGENTHVRMIERLMEKHHGAMLEFGGDPIVKLVCDRGVTHEMVRHRLCSFAQESTRYCNYSKDKFGNQLTFVIPPWFAEDLSEGEWDVEETCFYQRGTQTFIQAAHLPILWSWLWTLRTAEVHYLDLIKQGQSPQEARSVLPNSLKTEIVVKANTREWMHIFSQRCAKAAHPQMRELMVPLAKEFVRQAPTLYGEWA